MKIAYLLSNLKLVERNGEWLRAKNVGLYEKLSYYPRIFLSYTRLVIKGEKCVGYLGQKFYYDNPATPLNLQNYPFEINNKLLLNMDLMPKTILDVGANIGQFSVTVARATNGEAKIYSFEPNPTPFKILLKNKTKNTKVFNVGISFKKGLLPFYYQPNRSGIGSAYKENAGEQSQIEKINVMITNDVKAVTGRNEFDLIKIDVEGYELSVIKGLKSLKPKYLYLEASTHLRKRDYTESELFYEINRSFGGFEVVYATPISQNSPTYEILCKFIHVESKGKEK